jgi:hypothetical protein
VSGRRCCRGVWGTYGPWSLAGAWSAMNACTASAAASRSLSLPPVWRNTGSAATHLAGLSQVRSMLAVADEARPADGRSSLRRTPADGMPPGQRTLVGPEYVLRDAAGSLIAVVRHTVGNRVEVPPHGSNVTSCNTVLNKPGDGPALIIGRYDRLFYSCARVWLASGPQIGLIRQGEWQAAHLRFSSCICGRPGRSWVTNLPHRRICSSCGAEEGRLRKVVVSGSTRGWRLVDAAGMELGDITLRLYRQPDMRASNQYRQPVVRTLSKVPPAIRNKFSTRPIACEIVESSAHLDWNEHGLFLGLAAMCDPTVRRHVYPPSYLSGA